MLDIVVARFKVELGVPASLVAPTFPTRERGGRGDFALDAAAEEPAGVFVDPSVPDFNFFCGNLCQQVILLTVNTNSLVCLWFRYGYPSHLRLPLSGVYPKHGDQ